MGMNIVEKIIEKHIVSGNMVAGSEIAIKIDQTLTQDSTGTMAYLQFESMGIKRVKTKKSVAYIDHNMLQSGPENADDHKYIQTVAKKYGIYFSKPGNGICHQVHLERFASPGETLLGSDSHTPTCGGMGMLAIGAGGLDVAVAMAGGAYCITMPKVVKVVLRGKLKPFVTAKDVILELLRILSVKGGVGRVFEYFGDGVKSLTVPERATITNMGAELGATTSIFPSDEMTYSFLKAQGREDNFAELIADADAAYDEEVMINLSELEPLAAAPHSPDNVVSVSSISGIKVNQVAIGSCTNSSYADLMKVAEILKGKTVNENVSLVISPGSKQVLTMLANNGALGDIAASGARILECGCGPCIGMGQAPQTDGVSLRTFNRNFEGRSGTQSAKVYLVSPETAAVSALTGYIEDPRTLKEEVSVKIPETFYINDNMVISPDETGGDVEIIKGPNIKEFPKAQPLLDIAKGRVLIKVTDNITTDHIMPSNARLLPYRSNIPYLSDYCLTPCDNEFPKLAKKFHGGFILGGSNYGQGSSREHAALVPLYLGIKGVLAKSFARIHRANLINNGILPLIFENEDDYNDIEKLDELMIENVLDGVKSGSILVKNITKDSVYRMNLNLSEVEKDMLTAGGKLNYIKLNEGRE